jgi:hypothetical protein
MDGVPVRWQMWEKGNAPGKTSWALLHTVKRTRPNEPYR